MRRKEIEIAPFLIWLRQNLSFTPGRGDPPKRSVASKKNVAILAPTLRGRSGLADNFGERLHRPSSQGDLLQFLREVVGNEADLAAIRRKGRILSAFCSGNRFGLKLIHSAHV